MNLRSSALLLLLFLPAAIYAQTITWSSPVMVAGVWSGRHPRISLDGQDNPVILWGDNGGNIKISKFNGTGFTPAKKLNPDNMKGFVASWSGPELAAKGDTLYVVYKVEPEDTGHVYTFASYDGGLTFSGPTQVGTVSEMSRFPSITTDPAGNPVVAHMQFEEGFTGAQWHVSRSTDFGRTYLPHIKAGGHSGGEACDCCPSSVVATDEYIAMLYRDNLDNMRNIWAGISADGGQTFENGFDADQTNWEIMACPSTGPDGFILNDTLYMVFMSAATGGGGNVYFSRSSLITNALLETSSLSSMPGAENYPRIANYGKTAAAVWRQTDPNGTSSLGFWFTPDVSLGFMENFDGLATNVVNGDIIMDGNEIHIVYENLNNAIYYRKGTYALTGISEHAAAEIKCFPNPASGTLTLTGCGNIPYIVRVYNCLGQEIAAAEGSTNQFTFDASLLPAGVYGYTLARTGYPISPGSFTIAR